MQCHFLAKNAATVCLRTSLARGFGACTLHHRPQWLQHGGGGGSQKSDSVGDFGNPPFFKMPRWGFLRVFFYASTPFVKEVSGGIRLGCTSTVFGGP